MNTEPIIYFYCLPSGPPEATDYHHSLVCIAEGLSELGIKYYSSCNYWLQSTVRDDYLLQYNKDVVPDDCDLIIVESSYIYKCGVPTEIINKKRAFISVLIDNTDGVRTFSHTKVSGCFDLILRTHYNKKDCYYQTERVKPWAFGLSNRMLKELNSVSEWSEREQKILVSFGCMHPLRRRIIHDVLPRLKDFFEVDESIDSIVASTDYHSLMWWQTGRRHYPEYYKRLKNIAACAAFGGLTPPAWEVEPNLLKRYWRRRKEGYKTRILTQWDSWRLWESLAAGAVTFHIDFEKNDLLLPVMPENGFHYFGVDMDNIDEDLVRCENGGLLDEISINGRKWAIENYSPRVVAQRVLDLISVN